MPAGSVLAQAPRNGSRSHGDIERAIGAFKPAGTHARKASGSEAGARELSAWTSG